MTHLSGSNFVAITFLFIFHVEIAISWVLEFVDRTIHENHKYWYPKKIKPFTVMNNIEQGRLTE